MNASSAFRFTRRHFVTRIEEEDRPGVAARNRVQRGQVFRARHELTGAAFAPEIAKSVAELRRRRRQAEKKEIPPDMMEFQPAAPLNLDPKIFHSCLSEAPPGVAPSPGAVSSQLATVCQSRMRNQARTCGRTRMACGTTSNNTRMANKVTPSCQCRSVSVCTMRWKRCNKFWILGFSFRVPRRRVHFVIAWTYT